MWMLSQMADLLWLWVAMSSYDKLEHWRWSEPR